MKVVSLESISKILKGFKEKLLTEDVYDRDSVDFKINNVKVDTSSLLDKDTYKGSAEGVVKLADEAKGIRGSGDANPMSVYMKDREGNVGWMNFPVSVTKDDLNNYSATVMDVQAGETYIVNLRDRRVDYDVICQVSKFIKGEEDKSVVLKTFNNTESSNFDFDKDKVGFEGGMHIKNKYTVEVGTNSDNLYESEVINKSEFVEIASVE